MAAQTLADLAELENKNRRTHFESGGWRFYRRYYSVTAGFEYTLPKPGSVFPGATAATPPFIVRDSGVSGGPQGRKDAEEGVIVLTASEPILETDESTETYQYGA